MKSWKTLTKRKKWFLGGFGIVVVMFGTMFVMLMPEFGRLPNGEHLRAISTSPNYDVTSKRFINRRQAEYDVMMANFDYGALLKEQLFGKQVRVPK